MKEETKTIRCGHKYQWMSSSRTLTDDVPRQSSPAPVLCPCCSTDIWCGRLAKDRQPSWQGRAWSSESWQLSCRCSSGSESHHRRADWPQHAGQWLIIGTFCVALSGRLRYSPVSCIASVSGVRALSFIASSRSLYHNFIWTSWNLKCCFCFSPAPYYRQGQVQEMTMSFKRSLQKR